MVRPGEEKCEVADAERAIVTLKMRPRVFFDFALPQQERVIFELFNDIVPKTAENFRALATGEKGLSPISQLPLYYKNTIIHRAIKGFMIQGGDITKRNGTGGESIYGSSFPDENLEQPIDSPGLLVMANKNKPDTNSSQFLISVGPCDHLEGKHVVFGRVLKGMDVIEKISELPVDEKDRPLHPVVIVNCGELIKKQPPKPAERSRSRSVSAEEDDRPSHKRRHGHDDGEDKKEKKKSKRHKKKHGKSSRSPSPAPKAEPKKETEEEYDARLEREERERMEATRRHHLAELKDRYEREVQPSVNGVRYKGRGAMKFIDPETRRY